MFNVMRVLWDGRIFSLLTQQEEQKAVKKNPPKKLLNKAVGKSLPTSVKKWGEDRNEGSHLYDLLFCP
jgi:hypothetical protein